jgi:hypothetical protein
MGKVSKREKDRGKTYNVLYYYPAAWGFLHKIVGEALPQKLWSETRR